MLDCGRLSANDDRVDADVRCDSDVGERSTGSCAARVDRNVRSGDGDARETDVSGGAGGDATCTTHHVPREIGADGLLPGSNGCCTGGDARWNHASVSMDGMLPRSRGRDELASGVARREIGARTAGRGSDIETIDDVKAPTGAMLCATRFHIFTTDGNFCPDGNNVRNNGSDIWKNGSGIWRDGTAFRNAAPTFGKATTTLLRTTDTFAPTTSTFRVTTPTFEQTMKKSR